MSVKLLLVGCGNMGFAMLDGWLRSARLMPPEVVVVEPTEALRDRAARLGATVFASAADLPGDIDPTLVPDYARFAGSSAFVSVAAGISVATIESLLGAGAAIVRCMPNTPAAIGKGMMVTFANPAVSDETKAYVAELLATSGAVAEIDDEGQMDAVTAVSGSGPAYVFHFIEALTAAAETAGLPPETGKLLAMQTVYGAACLAKESAEEPGRLREQVTSPNGTTAAALAVLMGDDRLTALVTDAVEAARARSVELGK
jgi:pyrroline-5-carboxylate reductase